ncbi:MAG: hypothetical protein ACW986_19375, partial [Promethearchaeota archaeon]
MSLLIILPTLTIFSSLIANAQGGPVIPEPDPDNGWHWDVDVGDHMYFEGEFILSNATTGEIFNMWRDIWIYNITSISDVTIDWLGAHEFSQVNASQCYYNVTDDELESYGYASEIALFGYNSTDPITHRIRAGQNGMPFLLPINGSNGLEADILDDIINETFYYPMGQGGFNEFDYYESTPSSNRIFFSNSTDGFFSEGFYYDNGTLNTGTAYLMIEMGEGPVLINATMTQVFDYDITDEVQWGVNIGDKFYYDWYEGSYHDVMIEVTGFTEQNLNKTKNGFSDFPIPMVFQAVLGNISLWNGTEYILDLTDVPLGVANNFYPQYFDEGGPNLFNFLYPISHGREDFEFMWNVDTLRIWDAPFDEVQFNENGYFESIVKNSSSTDMVKSIVDKTTGIVQSYLMKMDMGMMYYEIKTTMTAVPWSVNPGDVIYYKENSDYPRDLRATILGTSGDFLNMTELELMLSSIGVTYSIPGGQPELQFFSNVIADIEMWDPTVNSWIYWDTGPIAIANTFWPIAPQSMGVLMGPPLLVPVGATGSDMAEFFNIFGPLYDVITTTISSVTARNSTMDYELVTHFEPATGRLTMMTGWANQPGGDSGSWICMSVYPKFYRALPPGVHSFSLTNDFPTGLTVNVDLEVGPVGAGLDFVYNFFPYDLNPVNVSLPNGTILAYFDQLFTDYGMILGNITMTITLPS